MSAQRTWLYLAAAWILALAISGCVSNQSAPASVATVSAVSKSLPAPQDHSVTLAWNQASNASGYEIYFGCASGSYTNLIVVGNITNATIMGLTPGVMYYFAATTLESSGLESAYSSELSFTIPCTNCPDIETNFVYAYGRQLCVQTDVVYWPVFVKWTNSLPGYPVAAYFRLLSTTNNLWQAQVADALESKRWSNIFGTVLSSRKPKLMLTNWIAFCVATNVTTNFGVASISQQPNINPLTQ